jgi:ADP-ribosylglycohydrolase
MTMRLDEDHFLGCLLGGAVGDALGAPIEFLSLAEIRRRFGRAGLADYAPAFGRIGAITDDTQMTMFTAEGLLRARHRKLAQGHADAVPALHRAYLRWLRTQGEQPCVSDGHDSGELDCGEIDAGEVDPERSRAGGGWLVDERELWSRRAPGNTCLGALRSGRCGTVGSPLNDSKGCGGVMRVAPAGMLCAAIASDDAADAFVAGCVAAAVTHGHPAGYLSAGAFAAVIFHVLRGAELEGAVDVALRLLRANPDHEETSRALDAAVRAAHESPDPTPEVVERVGGGWVAEEALAIALYCALCARGDFERGVLAAVNHSGDSDSTGAIAGNILGAQSGVASIRAAWLDALELRGPLERLARDLLAGYRDDVAWRNAYPSD